MYTLGPHLSCGYFFPSRLNKRVSRFPRCCLTCKLEVRVSGRWRLSLKGGVDAGPEICGPQTLFIKVSISNFILGLHLCRLVLPDPSQKKLPNKGFWISSHTKNTGFKKKKKSTWGILVFYIFRHIFFLHKFGLGGYVKSSLFCHI